jgi:drug/metabolite transporter (DMT)-like permease
MLLGLLFLFIGQIFGNTVVPIGTKISSSFTGPLLFVFLRFTVATTLLFLFFLFSQKRKLKLFEYKEFILLGFLLSINVIFFTVGIATTTVIMSTLIYSLTPILVGIAGHFLLDEPLDKQKILGLIISFVGLLLLVSQSLSSSQQNAFGHPLGNILICIAMVGYSFYVFQSRKVLSKKNHLPIQTTFLTFFFTTLTLFLVLLLGISTKNVTIKPLPVTGLIGFLIVGAGSIVQYLSLQIGIKRTSAFTATFFQYLAPFIAAAAAIPLLHEQVTIRLILGGILVLIGVFVATTYEQLTRYATKH